MVNLNDLGRCVQVYSWSTEQLYKERRHAVSVFCSTKNPQRLLPLSSRRSTDPNSPIHQGSDKSWPRGGSTKRMKIIQTRGHEETKVPGREFRERSGAGSRLFSRRSK
ncbi:hypothetical protein QLX08_004775 [Tetragonisca angustula]|uniref:Uncharacterized protein n=1 Tax=Tetragonisca angustula TaxID=166442 RepID=A0AAW1A2V6_9HYME